MKLKNESVAAKVSGDIVAKEFKVKVGPKFFSILSNNIYTDKIGAPIRELCTNALDSHIAAGKEDIPFEVYVPNTTHPYFKVRDFGTGMTPEEVEDLYTTYFSSSKEETDDQTGCFGLGSKSPFAYTSQFNITSYQNGRKHMYCCAMNEGTPQLMFLGEMETDEPTGFMVEFPVKTQDIYTFEQKIAKILRPYKTKPALKGCPNLEILKHKFTYETDGWGITRNNQPSYVVMGNVEYPIDGDADWMAGEAKAVCKLGLVLPIPLGSVAITVSRDTLEDTESTIAYLTNRLEEVYQEVSKHILKGLIDLKDVWELRKYINDVHRDYEHPARQFGYGEIVDTYIARGWDVHKLGLKSLTNLDADFSLYAMKLEDNYHNSSGWTVKFEERHYDPAIPSSKDNLTVIINDLTIKRGGTLIRRSPKAKVGTWMRDFQPSSSKVVWVIEPGTKAGLKFFLKAVGLGMNELVYASTLPVQPKAPKAKPSVGSSTSNGTSVQCKVYELGISQHFGNICANAWEPTDLELKDGDKEQKYYVTINRFKVIPPTEYHMGDPLNPGDTISLASHLGVTVYGIKKANLDKVEKLSNWVNLYDAAAEAIKKSIAAVPPMYYRSRVLKNSEILKEFYAMYIEHMIPTQGSPFTRVMEDVRWICGEYNTEPLTTLDNMDGHLTSYMAAERHKITHRNYIQDEDGLDYEKYTDYVNMLRKEYDSMDYFLGGYDNRRRIRGDSELLAEHIMLRDYLNNETQR